MPRRTTLRKLSSFDTCHSTGTLVSGIPPRPSAATGSGARRVHSTTPWGRGSPDAIPRVNGFSGIRCAARRRPLRNAVTAAPLPPSSSNLRRVMVVGHASSMSPPGCLKTSRANKPPPTRSLRGPALLRSTSRRRPTVAAPCPQRGRTGVPPRFPAPGGVKRVVYGERHGPIRHDRRDSGIRLQVGSPER